MRPTVGDYLEPREGPLLKRYRSPGYRIRQKITSPARMAGVRQGHPTRRIDAGTHPAVPAIMRGFLFHGTSLFPDFESNNARDIEIEIRDVEIAKTAISLRADGAARNTFRSHYQEALVRTWLKRSVKSLR
jgi:hypothetical protein